LTNALWESDNKFNSRHGIVGTVSRGQGAVGQGKKLVLADLMKKEENHQTRYHKQEKKGNFSRWGKSRGKKKADAKHRRSKWNRRTPLSCRDKLESLPKKAFG